MNKNNLLKLISSIAICQLAGIIGSIFTAPAIPGWYSGLIKPAFNPPSWIFGPVWITLYTLMGISLYLIWVGKSDKKQKKRNIRIFLLHLIFNSMWSVLFFGLKNPALALIDIIFLLMFISYIIWRFWKVNKLSASLLIPYWVWVAFASVLNFYLWRLNF